MEYKLGTYGSIIQHTLAYTRVISYQIAGGAAGFAYSFIMTLALLVLMQIISIKVPSFGLRAELSEDGKVNLDREELDDAEAVDIPNLNN